MRFGGFRSEIMCFALVFGLAYGSLATLFHRKAPLLYGKLDRAFDADLGSWTIDLARPRGPHERTRIHPISVLLLNPAGSALRQPLRVAGAERTAWLASGLLCAVAGGFTVGAFRVLLARLGVAQWRARHWTLLFGCSATQIFFSAVPESYAFSALSLVLVFVVAARGNSSPLIRVAAGVFSFGITVTNIVAVGLTSATAAARRRPGGRLRAWTVEIGAVVLATAALSLAQRAVYPTAQLFFVPGPLPPGQAEAFSVPPTAGAALARVATVASHVGFAGLAAPRPMVGVDRDGDTIIDFAKTALLTPTPAGAGHWLLWVLVLVQAGRGLARAAPTPATSALALWLGFEAALHFFFGTSLFLYSGHWVFAVVALAAAGLEARPFGTPRVTAAALLALLGLQLAANAILVRQVLITFAKS
jgi:hypothetical protein